MPVSGLCVNGLVHNVLSCLTSSRDISPWRPIHAVPRCEDTLLSGLCGSHEAGASESPGQLNTDSGGSTPELLDAGGWGWGPRICVSNKFSAFAAADVGTTPGEPPLQSGKAPFALKKDIIVASGSLSSEPGEGRESVEARAGVLRGRWLSARVRERIKPLSCLLLTETAVVHDSRFMSWAHPSQGFLAPQGVGGYSGDFQTVSWSDSGQRPRGLGTHSTGPLTPSPTPATASWTLATSVSEGP